MVNEDAALLNRPVTHMTPAALFNRRLQKRRAIRAKTNRFISSQRLQADTPEIRQQIIDQLERDLEC